MFKPAGMVYDAGKAFRPIKHQMLMAILQLAEQNKSQMEAVGVYAYALMSDDAKVTMYDYKEIDKAIENTWPGKLRSIREKAYAVANVLVMATYNTEETDDDGEEVSGRIDDLQEVWETVLQQGVVRERLAKKQCVVCGCQLTRVPKNGRCKQHAKVREFDVNVYEKAVIQ